MEPENYRFYCFKCHEHFNRFCDDDDMVDFSNQYGDWRGVECLVCGERSKMVGTNIVRMPKKETLVQPGGTRQISSAMLSEIKSGTRTKDGQFLSGKEARQYKASLGQS